MPPPNVDLVAEPAEGTGLGFAQLAPATSNGAMTAQLSLRLDFVNKQGVVLALKTLQVGFNPPPDKLAKTIALSGPTPDGFNNIPLGVGPGIGSNLWWRANDNMLLPLPFPPTAYISLSCVGFDPVQVTRPLIPHVTGYRFPVTVEKLGSSEFWQGQSAVHVPGILGWSLFAYDLVVVGFDSGWTELTPNGDPSTPKGYRAWGRDVHAMADGKVVSVRNDVPDEPISSMLPPYTQFEELDQPNPLKRPISGNHVKILCDNGELITHAHLRPGSVPVKVALNVEVKVGDKVGEVGNSGQSARPNLLIGCSRFAKGVPVPLSFKDICVLDRNEYNPATSSGPWFVVSAPLALPPVTSLIWPDTKPPNLPTGEPGAEVSPPRIYEFLAVDPLSLILSSSVYAILNKPRPVPVKQLSLEVIDLARHLDTGERRNLQVRLDAIKQYADGIQKLIGG